MKPKLVWQAALAWSKNMERVPVASRRHPTSTQLDNLVIELQPTEPVRRVKVTKDNDRACAALAAIEVLVWQLVFNRVLSSAPLADELRRCARYHPEAKKRLELLARIAQGAAFTETGAGNSRH